eukprot:1156911-Pelagomonas_calceolata.AAC.5
MLRFEGWLAPYAEKALYASRASAAESSTRKRCEGNPAEPVCACTHLLRHTPIVPCMKGLRSGKGTR